MPDVTARTKLVSLPVDAEGKVEAVSNPAWSTEYAKGYNAALAALPEAVVDDSAAELARLRALLVAWDRDATVLMASYYAQYPDHDLPEFTSPTDRLMREAHRLSGISPDPLPFVILDRSQLIEEIAKALQSAADDISPVVLDWPAEATDLLARVEDTP